MISSTSNARVKQVQRLLRDKRFRQRERLYVVEGTRWVTELVDAPHSPPAEVFYTAAWAATPAHTAILPRLHAAPQLVSDGVMAAMSDTETPAGVLALVPLAPRPLPARLGLVLALDGIGTPGNLGTMLRTAAAAGVDAVLLSPGCVDAYNPKVVRGSMGALLRLPVHELGWDAMRQALAGLAVWAAVVDDAVPYTAVSWQAPAAILIGSEAQGISPQGQALATGRTTIPIRAHTESLNAAVAAGVLLFEAVRQRTNS